MKKINGLLCVFVFLAGCATKKNVIKEVPIESPQIVYVDRLVCDTLPVVLSKEKSVVDSFPNFVSKEKNVCTKDENIHLNSKSFRGCLDSLSEDEKSIWLESVFANDSIFENSLKNRMLTFHYFQKQRKKNESRRTLNEMMNLLDRLEVFKDKALEWMNSETIALEYRFKKWAKKIIELRHAMKIGNSYTQLKERLDGYDTLQMETDQYSEFDALILESKRLDSLRLNTLLKLYQKNQSAKDTVNQESNKKLKNKIIDKYEYRLSKEDRETLGLQQSLFDNSKAVEYCENQKKKASVWISRSRSSAKKKKQFLNEAIQELNDCIEKFPDSEIAKEVLKTVGRIEASIQ